jgi:hypothetical protein
MRPLESDQARPIKWVRKWVECTHPACDGGQVPLTHDLDDDRTEDCPQCFGKGGYEMECES